MSLAIDVDKVSAVQLADGWHTVTFEKSKSTFNIDAYEFLWWAPGALAGDADILHGGGQSGICATGFAFKEGAQWVAGPITEIRAVKYKG